MQKRIALIGNMNNNFFAITRHLRDMGYDAHLFYSVGDRMDHFQPKADTFTLDYTNYCHKIEWLKNGFQNLMPDKVHAALKSFDFYIGQGDDAAAAYSCGYNMDVYYPYGSDVYKYAYLPQRYSLKTRLITHFRDEKFRLTMAQLQKGPLPRYIRGVIVNADNILAEYTNEDFEEKLTGLNFKGKYANVPMPFIYLKEYENMEQDDGVDVHWKSIIKKLRLENDFILLFHGRHEWKTYFNEFTQRNVHHLIIGFAKYIKKNPQVRARLITLEYGNDAMHSKELIDELGIADKVTWFPQMYRKDIMYLIYNVDVCSGEFGRSYLTFGTVIEAMQMKKPVIHYRDDSLYMDRYPTLYPLFNAKQPEEIENAIADAVANPDLVKRKGEEAYEWVKKYFIENPLNYLQNLVDKGTTKIK
jgi:glycosyltransferase involved in cell wall biosynthesis